jgi:hypothetical protein
MVLMNEYDYERPSLPHAPARREEWDPRAGMRRYPQRQYCLAYAAAAEVWLEPAPVRSYKPPVLDDPESTQDRPGLLRRMGRAVLRWVDTSPEPYGDGTDELPSSIEDRMSRISERLVKIKEEADRLQQK